MATYECRPPQVHGKGFGGTTLPTSPRSSLASTKMVKGGGLDSIVLMRGMRFTIPPTPEWRPSWTLSILVKDHYWTQRGRGRAQPDQ